MNIYALDGHKVRFKYPTYGYKYDQDLVKEHLILNEIYTIDYTIVNSWSTDVFLVEFPNIKFNSVHFEDYTSQDESLDKQHPDYYNYNDYAD